MTDFTVAQHGIDTSGRAILATAYMWDVWQAVVADLDFDPVIVQGAFMSRVPGGGAAGSEGYHDLGGCFDLRTRDLSTRQVDELVRVLRAHGCAAWRRDQAHGGFDPHVHFVLGTDQPLADGAAWQWWDYIKGGDGIGGNDYEDRPSPLVLTPPEDEVTPQDKQDIAALVVKMLTEGKPDNSDLTRDQLWKQAQGAADEARDMLKAQS